jgi:hypothetical protein
MAKIRGFLLLAAGIRTAADKHFLKAAAGDVASVIGFSNFFGGWLFGGVYYRRQ